jgi:hypothetical protein
LPHVSNSDLQWGSGSDMTWSEPRNDSHISKDAAKTMRPIIAQSLRSSPIASRIGWPRLIVLTRLQPMLNSVTGFGSLRASLPRYLGPTDGHRYPPLRGYLGYRLAPGSR